MFKEPSARDVNCHGASGVLRSVALHWGRRVAIAGTLALAPLAAHSQVITDGKSLKQRCASFQITVPSAGLGCRAYIRAVVDIMADENSIYEHRACPPPNVKRETMVKTVKIWLDKSNRDLRRRASALIAQALGEAYPCPKK